MTAIRRGWLHLATGAGVGRVLCFASNLMLSRFLGPLDLGLFNLVTTAVQTSDTLARCGGDYALNYELGGQPEAMKTGNGAELARALAQLCSLMTALICIGFAFWVGWGQGLFPTELSDTQRLPLTVLLLLMIFLEGTSAPAWEMLLASHRTAPLALRQGLFFPLRLALAAAGALSSGVLGAMAGWVLVSLVQSFWLKWLLGNLWTPFQIFPFLGASVRRLLMRGVPFYASNLLASIIFYPLLLRVAEESGLAEIGYLRVGQILQQLFAFVPATLVPVLFLKLRGESGFADQVLFIERPLRVIWFILLELLLLYCIVDRYLILLLFGSGFDSALLPTRVLLITALCEGLSQLIVQPFLAAGKIRIYGILQNGSAVTAAILGWLWIPSAGLTAYLIVRLIYVLAPLTGFGIPAIRFLQQPRKLLPLASVSICLLFLLLHQALYGYSPSLVVFSFGVMFLLVLYLQREDLPALRQLLKSS